ncbi:hypothetical protein [uncultured Parabacteroides sp.]|uniref:hypothetical protein n=1 Tax=uncultured Parabacteroides sp. TaxID=512312 RepID=UPI0026DBC679|nr:hypothetical protein [uncultured Parabacteroides sp.]
MATTISLNGKANVNSWRPSFDLDAQTNQGEKPIYAYLQNVKLSSKEKGSLQKEEISLLQLHYSNPDDILAQIVFVPKVIEIPDEVLQNIIDDSQREGHLDNPGHMGHNGTVSG